MSELLQRKQRKQAMIFSEPEDDIVVEDNMAAIRIDVIEAQSDEKDEEEDKVQHDAPIFVNDSKMLSN